MNKQTFQKTKKSKKSTFAELQRQQICDLAARIIHEDGIRDYHKAKLRACDTLGIKTNSFLPTNEEIQFALENRIKLFDSKNLESSPISQLSIAKDLLNILQDYQPRLTGLLLNGMKLKNSPIEIHAFSNSAEMICEELNWRGLSAFIIEKRFRYSNNQYVNVPLIVCHLDEQDIEISVFTERELHRAPICPRNGRPFERKSLKQLNTDDSSSGT